MTRFRAAVRRPGPGVGPGLVAMRGRLGSCLLFALAGVGWWWTAHQMRGMDTGPWSALGGFGWFLGVWVVMMAAMMLPSVAPTVALYSRMTRNRSAVLPLIVRRRLSPHLGRRPGWPPSPSERRGRRGRHRPGVGSRRTGSRRRDPARGGRLPALTAQGRVPRQVSQPARDAARILARRGSWALCGWA